MVRKLTPMMKIRLHELVGPSTSKVDAYMHAAFIAAGVCEIDGDRVPFPTTKLQLEALIERLDEDGLNAAGDASAKLLGITVDEDGNVFRHGEMIAAAKNS